MSKRAFALLLAACLTLLLLASGCSQNAQPQSAPPSPTEENRVAETEAPPALAPESPEPEASPAQDKGVITAAQWEETYPDIYESYMKNSQNSYRVSHIEEYPDIVTLYEGMAFNTYYDSAIGHVYTLQDVDATGRPTPWQTASPARRGTIPYWCRPWATRPTVCPMMRPGPW